MPQVKLKLVKLDVQEIPDDSGRHFRDWLLRIGPEGIHALLRLPKRGVVRVSKKVR